MNSGNPADKVLTPLERAWKEEEQERLRVETDMARALALGKKKEEDDIASALAGPKETGMHRIVPRVTINPQQSHESKTLDQKGDSAVFTLRWSPDNRCIATGQGSGRIAIYDATTGHVHYEVKSHGPASNEASAATVTSLQWRPVETHMTRASAGTGTVERYYTILAATASGQIQHWKVTPPNSDLGETRDVAGVGCPGMHCVNSFTMASGVPSAGTCVAYDRKGSRFAVGCKDAVVRIYDEETCKLTTTLDGGDGVTFDISLADKQLTDRGFYNMTTFQYNKIRRDSASEVIRKGDIKQLTNNLNNEAVSIVPRHSNRVYSCKFAAGHTSPTEHFLVSGGWDKTVQVWDTRLKGPPVKSFQGAYLVGDALDVLDSTILTGSHSQSNQLQLWDMRFGGNPVSITTTEGNFCFAAGFSKGLTGEVMERFICAAGVGPGPDADLKVYDNKRNNALSCKIEGIRGGVVALDWANISHADQLTASKKRNSSRGSVAGGKIAIACGDDSLKIVEVCTVASERFIDDDEDIFDEGVDTDSDVFENSLSRAPSVGVVRQLAHMASYTDVMLPVLPELSSSQSERVAPLKSPRADDPGSHHEVLLTSQSSRSASASGLPRISPRGTKTVTNDLLPLLAKPGFHTPKISPRGGNNTKSAPNPQNLGSEMDDAALAALLGNEDPEGLNTPAAHQLLAQAQHLMSPDNDAVDDHINQFLDDMQNR